ncbi:glycosyl transferase, family 8 [Brachyspira pilosicoli WesB]|uniref:Glycosyl transferase, family 8 n=1 Tax=Brachyspira pilosicoli WesB TaxID=1161918 RepID=K0JLN7_BRAPL|nr:glycosyltransferase family 8 protein [Brachyspira pilosicoli]CCG58032.1 glycosyl transferase, family 8 [Brachyspira pilosicoli WesB]
MKIDICFSSDNNYTLYMGTVITSILKNSSEDEEFTFHIIDGDIDDDNKNRILKLKQIKDFNIKYYIPDIKKYEDWFNKSNYKYHFSPAMFYRISIPSLINDVEKILYLDCDIILTSSLKELFQTNLENYYIAAVEEVHKPKSIFCAGVMLINNKLWIRDNIEKNCADYYEKNYQTCYNDQGILNNVLPKNKIKYLEKKWSYFADKSYHEFDPEDLKNAAIIHYIGSNKPLNPPARNSILKYEFWKYFRYTPWFKENMDKYFDNLLSIAINDRQFFTKKYKPLKEVFNKIAWWIPSKKLRDRFRDNF